MAARSDARQRRRRRMAEMRGRGDSGQAVDAAAQALGRSAAAPRRLRRRDVFLGAGAGVVAGGLLSGLSWFDGQSRLTVPEPVLDLPEPIPDVTEPIPDVPPAAPTAGVPEPDPGPAGSEKPFIAKSPEELDGHRHATLSHRLGDPGAPLLIVEYFSYTCSHCITYAAQIEPQVKESYIDTGQAVLVARHRPFDTNAISASRVAIAASQQDPAAFWPMHYRLLNQIRQMAANGYGWEDFEPIGNELGLDGGRLVQDAQSDRTSEILQANISEASGLEVNGTPTFFLNGVRMVGAGSLNEFLAAIEEALGSA